MRKIFTFGSNLRGIHGAGAALEARWKHGAQIGVGEGLTGYAYAIPTKDRELKPRTLDEIKASVETFLEFARDTPETIYQVTKIGCGRAGYTEADIAPMFEDAPDNCELPIGWRTWNATRNMP